MLNKIKNLKIIKKLIEQQNKGIKAIKRNENVHAEMTATQATEIRKQKGFFWTSDNEQDHILEVKQEMIREELKDLVLEEREFGCSFIGKNSGNNLKYLFADCPLERAAFFTVRPSGVAITIVLDTRPCI